MKPGKIPIDMLSQMLSRLPARDPRVVVGPTVGEDAAALDLGDRLMVAGMDPITFAADLIGWYAVQVNANDIAVMGADPRWFLTALLMPEGACAEDVAAIFDQLAQACDALSITPVGGHTEVTAAVSQPVIAGCMLGEVEKGRLVTTSGARPGDDIVLCGPAGVEGTALLAREAGAVLAQRGLDGESLARAREFLFDPGISVVRAARAANSVGVTAMHDPTEGGVATGLRELARAAGAGLEVHADRIPVLPQTREICDLLALDPLGLIASGSLLITVQPDKTSRLLDVVGAVSVPCSAIGRMLAASEGLGLVADDRRSELPEFERDEVARFFDELAPDG